MPATLTVYKIINPDKTKLYKGGTSKPQKTFADLNLIDELGESHSTLTYIGQNGDRIKYRALHYSETIKHPIRAYFSDIEDSFSELSAEEKNKIKKGTTKIDQFQEIYYFDVMIDFNTEEIFVFANKKIANSFMKRFSKCGLIDYKHLNFDMLKIDDIPELANIWGCWEDCKGRCKKKAYFGTEVNKVEGLDKKSVTSYNVEYEYDDENIIDLFINKECRISSKSKEIDNPTIYKIYSILKESLTVSIVEPTTESSPEEE